MTHPYGIATQSFRSHGQPTPGALALKPVDPFATFLLLAQEIADCPIAYISLSADRDVRILSHSFPASFALAELPADLIIGPKTGETMIADMRLHPVMRHAAVIEYSPSFVFWAGVPLFAQDDTRPGMLGLLNYHPQTHSHATTRALEHLASLIARQISAEDERRESVAKRVIGLIDELNIHEVAADPHVLKGILRLAADQSPRPVETTALRIAGLADISNGVLNLTPEGRSILSAYGFCPGGRVATQLELDTDAKIAPTPAFGMQSTDNDDPAAFARLRIGETSYVIGKSVSGALAFLCEGSGEWQTLRNGLEEGWAEISAEIIQKSDRAIFDYVRMHMIQRRDAAIPQQEADFDLHGLCWRLRQRDDGNFLRLGDGDWHAVSTVIAPGEAGLRDAAVTMLLQHSPDIAARIAPDVHAWAMRIAAGASVMPFC